MGDREQRLRELLQYRARQFATPSTVPSGLIRRARRSMLIVGLTVVIAVSVVGYGAVAGVRALRGSSVPGIRPTASPVASSPAPSPSTTSSRIEVPGASLALPLDGSVDQLVVGAGAVYAGYSPAGDFEHEVIARFDLQTHVLVRSETFPTSLSMALSEGNAGPAILWVAHWSDLTRSARSVLGLDPDTLKVVVPDTTTLSPPVDLFRPMVVIATPAGLWVSSGSSVFLLSDTDLHQISRTDLDGTVGPMSADPTGRFLYVATLDPQGSGPRSINQIKAAPQTEPQTPPTGAVLLRTSAPVGVGVNGLSATQDGVWVATATGLLGSLTFFRASDLKQTASYVGQRGAPVTNTIDAAVADGILWVTDGMIGVVACADPALGHLRSVVIPQAAGVSGFSNVTGVGSMVYVGIVGGVLSITPSSRCIR